MRLRLLYLSIVSTLAGAASIASYDVIIVGGGPGGLLAAEVLTRKSELSVLMLEAGPLSQQASGGRDVPSYAQSTGYTKFDIPGEFNLVAYSKENDKYRVDWIDTPYMWLGKLLGGCASINAALYFRTADSYIDKASWPFTEEQVNRGYAAIEELFASTTTPSTDGKQYLQEAYAIVKTALEKQGYTAQQDLNADAARNSKSKTLGHPPYAIKDGLRDAPAKTVFPLLQKRANFKLITDARVQYIQQKRGRATGVVYTVAGATQSETLTKRGIVVMAAGALNTPAILMQSGIGPRQQLQTLAENGGFPGVATNESAWVVNENVGQHVFDTTVVYASFSIPEMESFLSKKRPADAISQYMKDRSGPWATPGPVLIAYENVERNGREFELQTTVLPHGFGEFYDTPQAYSVGLFLNNPLSRDAITFSKEGELQVATNKAWYGSNPTDVDVLTAYVAKTITSLTATGSKFLDGDADQVPAFVKRKLGAVTHHFGGSCYTAVGSPVAGPDPRCADESFRVIGTENVYVSDGSLMKEGTVNPYGFIMYIGHQAGQNILEFAFANTDDSESASQPSSQDGSRNESDGSGSSTVSVSPSPSSAAANRMRSSRIHVVVATVVASALYCTTL